MLKSGVEPLALGFSVPHSKPTELLKQKILCKKDKLPQIQGLSGIRTHGNFIITSHQQCDALGQLCHQSLFNLLKSFGFLYTLYILWDSNPCYQLERLTSFQLDERCFLLDFNYINEFCKGLLKNKDLSRNRTDVIKFAI